MVLPLAPSASALPRTPENLRACRRCDQLIGLDVSDCPYCGLRQAALDEHPLRAPGSEQPVAAWVDVYSVGEAEQLLSRSSQCSSAQSFALAQNTHLP